MLRPMSADCLDAAASPRHSANPLTIRGQIAHRPQRWCSQPTQLTEVDLPPSPNSATQSQPQSTDPPPHPHSRSRGDWGLWEGIEGAPRRAEASQCADGTIAAIIHTHTHMLTNAPVHTMNSPPHAQQSHNTVSNTTTQPNNCFVRPALQPGTQQPNNADHIAPLIGIIRTMFGNASRSCPSGRNACKGGPMPLN